MPSAEERLLLRARPNQWGVSYPPKPTCQLTGQPTSTPPPAGRWRFPRPATPKARLSSTPSAHGGHNWHPMAYNPATGYVYIPAIEMAFPVREKARLRIPARCLQLRHRLDTPAAAQDRRSACRHVRVDEGPSRRLGSRHAEGSLARPAPKHLERRRADHRRQPGLPGSFRRVLRGLRGGHRRTQVGITRIHGDRGRSGQLRHRRRTVRSRSSPVGGGSFTLFSRRPSSPGQRDHRRAAAGVQARGRGSTARTGRHLREHPRASRHRTQRRGTRPKGRCSTTPGVRPVTARTFTSGSSVPDLKYLPRRRSLALGT